MFGDYCKEVVDGKIYVRLGANRFLGEVVSQVRQEDVQLIMNVIVAIMMIAMIISIIKPYIKIILAKRRLWTEKGVLL